MIKVYDAHCDYPWALLKMEKDTSFAPQNGPEHLATGGVALQVMAAWCGDAKKEGACGAATLQKIMAYRRFLTREAQRVTPVLSRDDLQSEGPGRILTLLAIEGGEALEGKLEQVEAYFRLGVRMLGLTWNWNNPLAGGAKEDGGLTAFGRAVLREMRTLHMIPDLAHLNARSFWDVLENDPYPPFVSHGNARALCEHPRNLTDAQIKAIISAGGFIGVNFYPPFLRADDENSGIGDVVAHILHILQLGGQNCVGLGSDFDGMDVLPKGIDGPQHFQRILRALGEAGLEEACIGRIAYGNLKRYLYDNLP